MADSPRRSSITWEAALQHKGGEPLTDAQRAFAKLLGRLLAQRWQEQQRRKEVSNRCER
jgi:hypothetical protein